MIIGAVLCVAGFVTHGILGILFCFAGGFLFGSGYFSKD